MAVWIGARSPTLLGTVIRHCAADVGSDVARGRDQGGFRALKAIWVQVEGLASMLGVKSSE